jgi:glycosyltransferase involved in cell wall biosynthesis
MGDRRKSGRVAVLSRAWGRADQEAAWVVRQLAGALSRLAEVDVVVPGPPGAPRPDGAFDVHAAGGGTAGGQGEWPESELAGWPDVPRPTMALVHAGDWGARALLDRFAPDAAVLEVDATVRRVGLHVAVNPLAAERRHNGIGFTGYLLILTDRDAGGPGEAAPGRPRGERPTPLAAWVTARFPRLDVVVVENAMAWVWRARSLRGLVGVDTRTDLWRLMAHARMVVDLRPGPLVARECVEAQRFGTPVIVPAGTPAADLAAAGGGLWFRDVAELLGCVAAFGDDAVRDTLGAQGRAVADERYGDPDRFVDRMAAAIETVASR